MGGSTARSTSDGRYGVGTAWATVPTPSHWSWFVMPALQLPLPLPPAVEAGALRTFTPPTCPLQLSPSVHVSSSQHPMMHAALTIRPYVPHPTPLPCSCRCRPRLRWGSCAPSRSGRCASCMCCTGVPWEAPRKGCGCLRLRHAPASGMSGGWPEGVREDSGRCRSADVWSLHASSKRNVDALSSCGVLDLVPAPILALPLTFVDAHKQSSC